MACTSGGGVPEIVSCVIERNVHLHTNEIEKSFN